MGLPQYFIGAGNIQISFLDADGNPTTFRDVGEVPQVEYGQTAEFADNFATGKEGPNLQDLHVLIRRTGALTLQVKERTKENLELILHGDSTSEAAGTFSGPAVALPTGIADGDVIQLPGDHMGISALVLTDSAGTPITLTSTNYDFDGDSRLITFKTITGLTQPIKVTSYSYKASESVKFSSKTPPPCCVIFDGINLAVPDQKVWARWDNVTFAPATTYALKAGGAGGTANEVAMYEIAGVCQLKAGNTQLDGYGEMRTY
jgi:hypothetical protein